MRTCERISEAFLIPVLEALLQSLPFAILGFHSDNGTEFINHQVAKLLNKLLMDEPTKNLSVNNVYLARHFPKGNDRSGEHVQSQI